MVLVTNSDTWIMTQLIMSAFEQHCLDARLFDCLRREWPTVRTLATCHLQEFIERTQADLTGSAVSHAAFVEAQLTHWDAVCDGAFDEAYLASLQNFASIRSKAGFGLPWLLACANFCGTKFAAEIRGRHLFASARASRFLVAFLRASILDLSTSPPETPIQDHACDERSDIATSLAQFECNISSIVAEAIDKTARLDAIADTLSMEAAATNEKLAYANEVSDLIVKRIEKAGEILREVLMSMSALGSQGSGTQEAATSAIARNREASHAIVGAVAKIDPIIGVISKVAAQTNLLALNARIEAARAGEFGKGFAVIATEVKTLAVQTATATEEISAQIAAIEKASALSAENIELSCRTIDEIAGLGQAMTSAVGEQGDATRRINRNISDAARFAHAAGESITAMVAFNEQTRQIAKELCLLSKSLGTGMMEVRTKAAGIRGQLEAG